MTGRQARGLEVEAYYDGAAQEEWDRLARHRTELAVSLRAMDEHLPGPPCEVVDIGGGPGRYAIELARCGYAVALVDISRECLRFARERAAEGGVSLAATIPPMLST
jgi:2-polyprenyl-3-methyl-5-hydroxy-6-metoxy-1,4-benzoquinol methylase